MSPLKRGLVAVALLLVCGLVVTFLRPGSTERVYPVDEVLAGVRQQPRAWVGRTILVRGIASGSGSYTLCTSPTGSTTAQTCRHFTWLYLGPVTALSRGWGGVSSMYGYNRPPTRGYVPTPLPRLTAARPVATLSMLLRAGTSPPALHPHRPLPAVLYNLPLVGAPLARLFPWDTTVVVRVRLTSPYPCAAATSAPCTPSIQLEP